MRAAEKPVPSPARPMLQVPTALEIAPMAASPPHGRTPDPRANAFYRDTLALLQRAEIPFLVGGAFAFGHYTGISRDTKDFDLFLLERDAERALGVLADGGYRTELTFPHWLGKAFHGDH